MCVRGGGAVFFFHLSSGGGGAEKISGETGRVTKILVTQMKM